MRSQDIIKNSIGGKLEKKDNKMVLVNNFGNLFN